MQHVGAVQPAAQAGLDDRPVRLLIAVIEGCNQRIDFKHAEVIALDEFHLFIEIMQKPFRRNPAVRQADAVQVADQMRRRVHAGAETAGGQDILQETDDAALAVGAGDVDAGKAVLGIARLRHRLPEDVKTMAAAAAAADPGDSLVDVIEHECSGSASQPARSPFLSGTHWPWKNAGSRRSRSWR